MHSYEVWAAGAEEPGWARVPLATRPELLHGVCRAVAERADELTALLVAEGHPVRLATALRPRGAVFDHAASAAL
ncbi:hypothetical protein [Streptomyces sp. NPDC059564]|uniref:hypothetical protein n=1 Tax=Streptomyces sp. NPDC059564 TaxID=3346865 RepID=UPI00367AC140